jgi:2-polyprenyl-3-methyl-5-hydroxy-6-metoxy-1,4-benzoquinol methylase
MSINNTKASINGYYGEKYQLNQANKYRDRNSNHWKLRIQLAHNLVSKYVLPQLKEKQTKDIIVADVGCSIGTFAIEFAKLGYRSYGVDFNPAAIKVAKKLSKENGVQSEFICGDVTDWQQNFPPIDIAVCFDIFEHLHDDELGAFLKVIKKQLSKQGSLIFHTYPTQYNHIFYGRSWVKYPLLPFKNFSISKFNIITKVYAGLLDIAKLLTKGSTQSGLINDAPHCNPTTEERISGIFKRAGFNIVYIGSSNLTLNKETSVKLFSKQPIAHSSLYGVVSPK